jgi:hypothetical protein
MESDHVSPKPKAITKKGFKECLLLCIGQVVAHYLIELATYGSPIFANKESVKVKRKKKN